MSKDRKQTLLILGGIQARFQDLRKPLKVHSHFASVLEISGDFNELVYFKQINFQKVQFSSRAPRAYRRIRAVSRSDSRRRDDPVAYLAHLYVSETGI